LGNVRLSLSDTNADGILQAPEATQSKMYYAFGLSFDPIMGANKYAYNDKEYNNDFGLGLYDYGARMYDAASGRWNGVDALSEKYASTSMYAYVLNSPMRLIDKDGRSASDIIIKGENQENFNWSPNAKYEGNDVFIKNTVMALDKLSENRKTADFLFKGRNAVEFSGNAVLDYAKGGKLSGKDITIMDAKYNKEESGVNAHVTGTVFWNPSIGVSEVGFQGSTTNGSFPSMGLLLHEMGHAALYYKFGGADWRDRRSIFPDEERMIIDRLETPAMKGLGFGFRTMHNVETISVEDFTAQNVDRLQLKIPLQKAFFINCPTPISLNSNPSK
jgi:RHS repeat-associated protein